MKYKIIKRYVCADLYIVEAKNKKEAIEITEDPTEYDTIVLKHYKDKVIKIK